MYNKNKVVQSMKNLKILCFILLSGCGASSALFNPYIQEKTFLLFPDNAENSPRMSVSLRLLAISGDDGLRDCVYEALYENTDPISYTEEVFAFSKDQYDNAKPLVEEFPDALAVMNWEYRESVEAAISGGGVQITKSWEGYTGGAHGNYGKTYFVFERDKAKKWRRILLSDIIKPSARESLTQSVEASLRRDAGLPQDAALSENGFFEDHIETPSYFFLTREGLGFHWDPYEIAPYVRGYVETVLPYKEIEGALTDQGKTLTAVWRTEKNIRRFGKGLGEN
jgi:hypothetical protein